MENPIYLSIYFTWDAHEVCSASSKLRSTSWNTTRICYSHLFTTTDGCSGQMNCCCCCVTSTYALRIAECKVLERTQCQAHDSTIKHQDWGNCELVMWLTVENGWLETDLGVLGENQDILVWSILIWNILLSGCNPSSCLLERNLFCIKIPPKWSAFQKIKISYVHLFSN